MCQTNTIRTLCTPRSFLLFLAFSFPSLFLPDDNVNVFSVHQLTSLQHCAIFSLISTPSQTLLSDPWLVISPLLTAVRMSIFSAVCHPSVCPSFTPPLSSSHLSQAPEAAAKLQPVCRALNIDKDDFASKRIMAAYDRISGESGVLTENLYVTGERDCKSVFLCFHRLTYASLLRERDPSRQHNASHREDCARCAFPVFLSLYVSHRG